MKQKTIEFENVCQLGVDEIVDQVLSKDYIDYFGQCEISHYVKNDKLVATIKNNVSHIKISIDMNDVAKKYGYKNWKYIKVVDSYYDSNDNLCINHTEGHMMIQFSNKIK